MREDDHEPLSPCVAVHDTQILVTRIGKWRIVNTNRLYTYSIFGTLEKVREIGDLRKIKPKPHAETSCRGHILDEIRKRVGYSLLV